MNKDFLNNLNDVINSAMHRMNVPGAQVAIVKDGEVIYTKAFGYADVEKKVQMTTEHMLPIGSASKSFTAAAAVMLADEEKWNLDEPLKTYMPEFELYDTTASAQATARDLMCHRTGVPRHDLMWYNWNDLKREDLVKNRMKYLKNNIPFRSGFQYSNQMYAVVGYLIEKISGTTWEEFVEEKIFKPLSIENYSFCIPYPDESHKYTKLYTPDEKGVNKENIPLKIGALGPAGSINMSIGEFIKWTAFQMNGGKVGNDVLISENNWKELYKPNIPYQILPFEFTERTSIGYALGWTVDIFRGHKVVDHGGNVNGGSALMSFMPEENLGIAVLTNANSNMFVYALSMEIYDRYLGFQGEKDWFESFQGNMDALLFAMKEQLNAIYSTKIDEKPYSHELEEYTGTYSNQGYGEVEIMIENSLLQMKYHDNEMEVKHLHYDIFTFELFGGPHPVSFFTGVDGKVASLCIPFELTVDPIIFKKK